jgi:hypothetical protein
MDPITVSNLARIRQQELLDRAAKEGGAEEVVWQMGNWIRAVVKKAAKTIAVWL